MAECEMDTMGGRLRVVTYQDVIGKQAHFALVKGAIDPERPISVRVHVRNTLCDLFGAQLPECGWPLRDALTRVTREDAGVVVILGHREEPREIIRRMRGYQFKGTDATAEPVAYDSSAELRQYGLGAQILLDLGVRRMRVLGAPRKLSGLSGFGLEILEYLH
jgi:3,4-dihydroxy 2-butanone 4-phosphate synthase/GTP cyclohydrolase II